MEPQGISRVGQTVLARLMESQIWHQPAGSVSLLREGSEMGQWPLLALMPETSVSSCIALMPFKLLPWCWCSEGVSQSKFLYGFFKGNCLGLKQFLLPSQSLLIFAAISYGDLSSWHWNLSTTNGCGTSSFCVSAPPTSLDKCGFFNSVIVRLPFN